jgi:diguanylate cyclase (GGDEF)-like protein
MNQKSTELIRPDDLPKAAAVVRQLNSGAEDAMIAARVRKRNGEYLWVESSLRVVRDPVTGAPTGILNMVRDITERKQAEQKLQEAYRAVETLAITDALTGLANRRQFDQCLTTEWRRGLRDRNPLAMLLIDVDLFKSYNDTYGHVRGDSCLKQIAEAALDAAARPGDLVARFGGEEFAVILPNTDSEGALQVANEICDGLRRRSLEHSTNPLGILTISVGCAAMVPSLGQHAIHLIELADEALYTAKRNGRSQVCTCNAMASSGSLSPAADLSELFIAKTA